MLQKLTFLLLILLTGLASTAQNEYLEAKADDDEKTYRGGETYEVKTYSHEFKKKKPKNVILLIGDGMGIAQLHAGMTANRGSLFIENLKYMGLAKTSSAKNYITDSAAGGTALATGQKTYNGAISVDLNDQPIKTILEEASEKGLATGLVASSGITHATPASFIAHQPSRNNYEEIAAEFLNTNIDVFIGGGHEHFSKRKDGRNLINELKERGYVVEEDLEKIKNIKSGKLAGLTAPQSTGRVAKRGDLLPVATQTAVNILSNNKKGFFLMVEGSQIDWGGHAKSTVHVIEDMLDFDKTVGVALEFASNNKETLVVVTADHETGGMAILNGDYKTGMVKGEFSTGGHTALMVPVFAFGPGAQDFIGIMENTDIHDKMKNLMLGN